MDFYSKDVIFVLFDSYSNIQSPKRTSVPKSFLTLQKSGYASTIKINFIAFGLH